MNLKIFAAALALAAFCGCGYNGFIADDGVEMRIMSYNVHHCEGGDKRVDYERVAGVIKRENPDFVGLQELDCKAQRTAGVDQAKKLEELTGMYATYAKAIPLQGGSYGVALLSCEKPLSVIRKPLPGKEPRVLLLCEFADRWVGTTHLALQEENRVKAAQIIRSVIAENKGKKPVFMTGDWNAKPASETLAEFRKSMKILSAEKGRTYFGFKTHAPESECCIDYIAVDKRSAKKFSVRETYVVSDIVTSDHCPVVAVVEKAGK
jgi:endonuclease/exonuclease/phosphatase family metal-dependent hydrolase